MNHDVDAQLAAEQSDWEAFDLWSQEEAARMGLKQSPSDAYDVYRQYKAERAGEKPKVSLTQELLIKFDRTMSHYARYFALDPEKSQSYYKLRDAAYEALGSPGAKSDISKGVSWWFDEVADPYYTERDKLYKELDTAKDPSLVYLKIQELANKYNEPITNPDFRGTFPSPEEYVFGKLNPKDQRTQIAHWAVLPASYLTQFQREQVGYDIPQDKQDEMNRYMRYATKVDHQQKVYESQHGISVYTNQHDDDTALGDRYKADKAEALGISDYLPQLEKPEFHRVDDALDLSQRNRNWKRLASLADQIIQGSEAREFSISGGTPDAERIRNWFADQVNQARKKDPELDGILNQLSEATDHPNVYDLYNTLFFDVFIPG